MTHFHRNAILFNIATNLIFASLYVYWGINDTWLYILSIIFGNSFTAITLMYSRLFNFTLNIIRALQHYETPTKIKITVLYHSINSCFVMASLITSFRAPLDTAIYCWQTTMQNWL